MPKIPNIKNVPILPVGPKTVKPTKPLPGVIVFPTAPGKITEVLPDALPGEL